MDEQNQLMRVSEQSAINTSLTRYNNDNCEFLSVYNDKPLSKGFWESGIKQLKAAFPMLQDEWFNLLTIKMKEKKFTQMQFKDAIDNVITNCKYPTPQIADVLNYQKGVLLISRERFLKETKDETADFKSYFVAVDVKGQLFYANKSELERNKIAYKLWNKPVSKKIHNYKPQADPKEPLNKEFSFIYAFNEIVKKTGAGDFIPERD